MGERWTDEEPGPTARDARSPRSLPPGAVPRAGLGFRVDTESGNPKSRHLR